MIGWKFKYLEEVETPAELPVVISAARSQQFRWNKGGAENFRKSVFAAAANAKRKVRIMHQLTQPVDHAVSIFHPEGEYLKGLVLFVE